MKPESGGYSVMSQNRSSLYTCTIRFSGLDIELVSDELQLLEINFVKKSKKSENGPLSEPIKKAVQFLDDYFKGKKSNIKIVLNKKLLSGLNQDNSEILYLSMDGYTENEIKIYRSLISIKPGERISYGDLALISGIPRGGRFAGNCMAGNRFPVIIPCHRVVKSDGSIGNYSGGPGIKELLLKHETENFSSRQ